MKQPGPAARAHCITDSNFAQAEADRKISAIVDLVPTITMEIISCIVVGENSNNGANNGARTPATDKVLPLGICAGLKKQNNDCKF